MFDLKAEFQDIAQSPEIPWDLLENKTVLITGATGLIGSACVRTLLERNRAFGSDIAVKALVRSEKKTAAVFEGYDASDGLQLVIGDVRSVSPDECAADFILHTACPTASRTFVEKPVETADSIVGGTVNMLRAARDGNATSFVYVSSMEVYGEGNDAPGTEHLLTEHDLGMVDPAEIRSCYPEGKRMAEQYCSAYAHEYSVPAKVVRLAQTFGPGIPKDDARLFAKVARCAASGEDVVLKTTGESTRMYLYTADAVRALLIVLLKGETGCTYNAANPSTYSSVRGMAETILHECGDGTAHVRIEVDPNAPYPPEHHLPLDVSRLTALGWQPEVDLVEMYRNLLAYLEG